MMRGGVVWHGQGPHHMVWCAMGQGGVVRSVLVLFGVEGTGVVDVVRMWQLHLVIKG
jgi:hypothetical protein